MVQNWDLTQPQHNVTYEDTIEHQIDEACRHASNYHGEGSTVLWPKPIVDMFGRLDKRIKGTQQ